MVKIIRKLLRNHEGKVVLPEGLLHQRMRALPGAARNAAGSWTGVDLGFEKIRRLVFHRDPREPLAGGVSELAWGRARGAGCGPGSGRRPR
eukprot:7717038-Pyramimonas_sp.AAC.1